MIIDENGKEIENPDLEVGYLSRDIRIKSDATPIDNITKFAWDDDDYEEIHHYIVIPETERIKNRVAELKKNLSDTDYISSKLGDSLALCSGLADILKLLSSFKSEYLEVLEQRQAWRDEINRLTKE